MNSRRMSRILKVAAIAIVALGVFGLVVKSLWNWLMPELFGIRAITYWQALGVWILSRILLGGFHGRRGDRHWRARLIDRWEQMSPEERARFREGLRRRWGSYEEAEKTL
jgi:hypothetical protein